MSIPRGDFLQQLKIVAPALNTRGIIPELQNFYFVEDQVATFSGRFVMRAPSALPLAGGVQGPNLLGMLDKSRARTVEIAEETAQEITLKLGVSRVRFPLAAPYEIPKLALGKKGLECPLTPELIHLLELGLINGSDDPALEDRSGILFRVEKGVMECLSTDNKTLTWAAADCASSMSLKPIAVSSDVVGEIIRLWKAVEAKTATLFLSQQGVAVVLEVPELGGNCSLTASIRPVPASAWTTCTKVLDRCEDNPKVQKVEVPNGLAPALDRALVLNTPNEPIRTIFSIEDSTLVLTTTSKVHGEIVDRVKIGGKGAEFKEVVGAFEPLLLKRSLKYATHIGFSETELSLSSQDFLHLIAVTTGPL